MVVDAVLIPVAYLLGGLRWTREVVGMAMWVLIRIPKISAGLEGEKYDKLIKISYAYSISFLDFFSDVDRFSVSHSPSSGGTSRVSLPLRPYVSCS